MSPVRSAARPESQCVQSCHSPPNSWCPHHSFQPRPLRTSASEPSFHRLSRLLFGQPFLLSDAVGLRDGAAVRVSEEERIL